MTVFAFFGRPGAKLQWGMEVDQHSCDGRLRQNGILQTWTGYDDLGNDFFSIWLILCYFGFSVPSAEDAPCCMYGLWGSVTLGYTAIFPLFFKSFFSECYPSLTGTLFLTPKFLQSLRLDILTRLAGL